MALTYGGVALGVLPPDCEEWIEFYHTTTDWNLFPTDWFSTEGIEHLPLPPEPLPEPVRIGVLTWPSDLSRCASFYGVVDSTSLAAIRTALGTDSAGPANLVMTDGTGNTRTFSLYLIAAVPLFQVTGASQLYLLVLSDKRYFLRQRTGSITAIPASWSALFTSLATQLGITLTPASIDSDYGTPTDRWVFHEEQPLSVIVDAAAAAVGHRVVANLDGTFKTVLPAGARTDADTQYDLLTKTAGGQFVEGDLRRPVPAAVEVHFVHQEPDNAPHSAPHTVTKTLASLALDGYGSATGVASQTKSLFAELVYTGSNGTARDNYATQAAGDWYLWQLCDLDATLPGTTQWTPTGAEDRVEWKYQSGGRLLTRVVRGLWRASGSGTGGSGSGGSNGSSPTPGFRTLSEPLNSQPATETFVYAGPTHGPTDTFAIQQVALVGPDSGPFYVIRFYPEGTDNFDTFVYQLSHNASNELVSETYVIRLGPVADPTTDNDTFVIQTRTPTSETYTIQIKSAEYERVRTEDDETYAIRINGVTATNTISEAAGAIVQGFEGVIDFTGADEVDFTGTTVTGLSVSGGLAWVPLGSVTAAQLTDADLEQDVNVYSLPAGKALHAILMHTAAAGDGGGVGQVTVDLLLAGNSLGLQPLNGFVVDSLAQDSSPSAWGGPVISLASASQFALRVTADVNVADLSAGQWDLYGVLADVF